MRLIGVIAFLTLLFILTFLACGRGHNRTLVSPEQNNSSTDKVPDLPVDPASPERNVLIVRSNDLTTAKAGDEFDVTLAYRFCEQVYQGSGRLLFDSEVVEPVKVTRGTGIPKDTVFMCRLAESDFVPFAFTSLDNQPGIETGEGTLLTVKFRFKKTPENGIRFRLLNNAEFLQLRDKTGKRLSFDLSSEVVSK